MAPSDDTISTKIEIEHLSEKSLDEIIKLCYREQSLYRHEGKRNTPGSVELFRRALMNDQEAWTEFHIMLEPIMRSWIRWYGKGEDIEAEDIIQEAFFAFVRAAPFNPHLVEGNEISRVLMYLRKCIQTTVWMHYRKKRIISQAFNIDEMLDIAEEMDVADLIESKSTQESLLKRVSEIICSDEERLVFVLVFMQEMKPKEIVCKHRKTFSDTGEVYNTIKRVKRKLQQDMVIQEIVTG